MYFLYSLCKGFLLSMWTEALWIVSVAPVSSKMCHICSQVKATICRLVYVNGRCNIPSFQKSCYWGRLKCDVTWNTKLGVNSDVHHMRWKNIIIPMIPVSVTGCVPIQGLHPSEAALMCKYITAPYEGLAFKCKYWVSTGFSLNWTSNTGYVKLQGTLTTQNIS